MGARAGSVDAADAAAGRLDAAAGVAAVGAEDVGAAGTTAGGAAAVGGAAGGRSEAAGVATSPVRSSLAMLAARDDMASVRWRSRSISALDFPVAVCPVPRSR